MENLNKDLVKPTLVICIPTFNHSDYIEFLLQQYLYLNKYDVRLEIHDSSTDGLTEKKYDEYKTKYNNLFYKHYNNIHVDLKTIMMLESSCGLYTYLCGDGVYLNENGLTKILSTIQEHNPDLIEIYETINPKHYNFYLHLKKKFSGKEIQYFNKYEHFKDNIRHTPYYGGTIVKSDVFKTIDSRINQIIGLGFVYPFSIYTFDYENFHSVLIGGDFLGLNPYKKAAIWVKEGQHLEIWRNNFPESVEKIYECTFAERRNESVKVIHESSKKLKLIRTRDLLKLKSYGKLNKDIYLKYKNNIDKYGLCSKATIYFVFICPNVFTNILLFIKRHIK